MRLVEWVLNATESLNQLASGTDSTTQHTVPLALAGTCTLPGTLPLSYLAVGD
jgi:hypothetical protein